jgi:hypothetical protein
MSMSRCECGQPLALDDIKCTKCGKKFTIEPRFTGFEIPEPPIDQWREELLIKREYSEESLAEVKREAENRKKAKRTAAKSRVKNISALNSNRLRKKQRDFTPSISRSSSTNWLILTLALVALLFGSRFIG